MRLRILRFSPVIIALVAAAPTVRADESNPAAVACQGKAANDPCSVKRPHKTAEGEPSVRAEPGTCQPDQCCVLDYSGGSPPKTTCGPCLACKAGGPPPPSATGSGGTAVEPPRTSAADPPAATPSKRGCSVDAPGAAAPLVVLFALPWLERRRRRSPTAG